MGASNFNCHPGSGDGLAVSESMAQRSGMAPWMLKQVQHDEGNSGVRFAGYAAIFDRVDRGGDVVRRGAFAASLARGGAVPLLWQHDPGRVIGTVETLGEDVRGLRVVARVEPRVGALVAARRVTGLSFGYRVKRAAGNNPRVLHDVELIEVSLVARPMQPLARVIAVGV